MSGETDIASSRLAFSVDEAAMALGVSRDFFDRHVRPELRVIRRGRLILVPAVNLQEWLVENAQRPLEAERERFR